MLFRTAVTVSAAATLLLGATAEAQSLRGSRASMDRQNAQARAHDFTFLRDGRHVTTFVNSGLLVPLRGNSNYELHAVSYPYARPEVKLFVERLSAQFRAACGEKLVVTSLTRPQNGQPRNASARSVHPTGMALDIRRHNTPTCRRWLERVLLSLEGSGVLEVEPRTPTAALPHRDLPRPVPRLRGPPRRQHDGRRQHPGNLRGVARRDALAHCPEARHHDGGDSARQRSARHDDLPGPGTHDPGRPLARSVSRPSAGA